MGPTKSFPDKDQLVFPMASPQGKGGEMGIPSDLRDAWASKRRSFAIASPDESTVHSKSSVRGWSLKFLYYYFWMENRFLYSLKQKFGLILLLSTSLIW